MKIILTNEQSIGLVAMLQRPRLLRLQVSIFGVYKKLQLPAEVRAQCIVKNADRTISVNPAALAETREVDVTMEEMQPLIKIFDTEGVSASDVGWAGPLFQMLKGMEGQG